jgi:hypothetical protein
VAIPELKVKADAAGNIFTASVNPPGLTKLSLRGNLPKGMTQSQ